jgi:aminoglycoside 6'-N-acetyltransferase
MPRLASSPRYTFRLVQEDDLDLLSEWLRRPLVAKWWGDPERSIEEIRQAMDDISVLPFIVELDDKPIAYVQTYDPHLEDGHPYQDQPFGTYGIDISIGDPEMIGKGYGPAIIEELCSLMFNEVARRLIIDPHPDNARAIRAYEKAGFAPIGERSTIYGDVLLMARNNEEIET